MTSPKSKIPAVLYLAIFLYNIFGQMKNIRILENHSWALRFRNPTGTRWDTQGMNSS